MLLLLLCSQHLIDGKSVVHIFALTSHLFLASPPALSQLNVQLRRRVAFDSARRLVNFSSQFQLRPHQSAYTEPVSDKVSYIKRELSTRLCGHSRIKLGCCGRTRCCSSRVEICGKLAGNDIDRFLIDRFWRLNEISAYSLFSF